MIIISGGKGTGKTKALVAQAVAADGILVCENPIAMRERVHGYGIAGLEIISYEEVLTNKSTKPIYIHDINQFIARNFGNIKGYTVCNK